MISDKEFSEWLEHPVTSAVRKYCAAKREEMRREWESHPPTDYLQETYVMGNVANLGRCDAFKDIEELEFDQLIGVLHE